MNASRLADAVCPGVVHPQVRYKHVLRNLLQPGTRWLDLGCGHEVIRPWALLQGENETSFTHAPTLSVGVDGDVEALRSNQCTPNRVAADLHALPFAGDSFDIVTSNMVLEHSNNPPVLMSEVWRVLRGKGVFVFHTPNKYYPVSVLAATLPDNIKSRVVTFASRRSEKDVYPTFYRINSGSAISRISADAGFRIKHSELLESLTFNSHRSVFLFNLALTWLLRRKVLSQFKPVYLVMLCKPDIECACKRLERSAA